MRATSRAYQAASALRCAARGFAPSQRGVADVQRRLGQRGVQRRGLRAQRERARRALGLARELVGCGRLAARQREACRPAERPRVADQVVAGRRRVDQAAREPFAGLEVAQRDVGVRGERRNLEAQRRVARIRQPVQPRQRLRKTARERVGPAGPHGGRADRRRAVRRRAGEQVVEPLRPDPLAAGEIALDPLQPGLERERAVAARVGRARRDAERRPAVVAARFGEQPVDQRQQRRLVGARGPHARQRGAHAVGQARDERGGGVRAQERDVGRRVVRALEVKERRAQTVRRAVRRGRRGVAGGQRGLIDAPHQRLAHQRVHPKAVARGRDERRVGRQRGEARRERRVAGRDDVRLDRLVRERRVEQRALGRRERVEPARDQLVEQRVGPRAQGERDRDRPALGAAQQRV